MYIPFLVIVLSISFKYGVLALPPGKPFDFGELVRLIINLSKTGLLLTKLRSLYPRPHPAHSHKIWSVNAQVVYALECAYDV